jgi:hypothetical protein
MVKKQRDYRRYRRRLRTTDGRMGRFLLGFIFGLAAGGTIYLLTDNVLWGLGSGFILAVVFGVLSANKLV